MSTKLPVTFSVSPFPPGKPYNPQEFANAFAARLSIDSQSQLSFFVSSPAEPSSNVGPWLKDGVTWYSWDSVTGAYVPQPMDYLSLKYVAQSAVPNHNNYTFWIKLDGAGRAQSIQYWSGGSWVDVYADTFANIPTNAQMNAAIAAALTQYPFRANVDALEQVYTAGTGDEQIVFDDVIFSASGAFSSNQFTAPVDGYYRFHAQIYLSLDSGTPTDIDRQLKLFKNGFMFSRTVVVQSSDTGGLSISVEGSCQMTAGDIVDARLYVISTGASTWAIERDATTTFFEGNRIIA